MQPYIVVIVLVAVIGVGVFLAWILGRTRSKLPRYDSREYLLSAAERSFFGVLANAVGPNYFVAAKVRVADALMPRKGMSRSEWQSAFNRISAKHFDFLICHVADLRIVAAVELDDRSHGRSRRQTRDEFLDAATMEAGLPLLRFGAKSGYSQAQIRESFAAILDTSAGNEESATVVSNS